MKELSKEDQERDYARHKDYFDSAFNEGYNQAIEEIGSIVRNGRGSDIEYKAWLFNEIAKLKK